MSEIDFSVQVISDKFLEYRVSSSASASEVLARVLKDLTGDTGKVNPNEYKVLIAYQLLSPELSLEKLFQDEEKDRQMNIPTSSLEDLNLKTGYYVFFIKPGTVTTKLEININGSIYLINKQNLFVGRKDDIKGIFPELDLTPYLGEYENKISRELLTFREVDGKWKVKLHPNSHSSVFVDGAKLKHGEEKDIGSTINIGNSPEDPFLKLKTRIIND